MALKFLAFLVVLVAAAAWDLRQSRIPNRLILAALAMGVLFGFVQEPGWAGAVTGAALALMVSLPLFAAGAIGGGDGKLLMVVGAFLGPIGFISAALYAGVLGGVLVALVAVRRGTILPLLHRVVNLLVYGITLGRRGERHELGSADAVTIPYGLAISAGALVAWFLPILSGGPG